ncbi:CoA pyrophosphatase [Croceicoccus gelatinilyticus]|uniref:CoA pyrophosphatase n=1 Tax=Croceicoccus gelatinilyticus TaxID=2835536 RepID=UPI001BCF7352|nr:CoA pyrophosphatase [Croceicoccus gelatinilyticus]MBS7668441.1 CoA pyrophosphatase [Croceicoccus gelatinilyticus]
MSAIRQRLTAMHRSGHRRRIHDLRDEGELAEGDPRDAAVLIAVTERRENPGVLLIERPAKMRNHGGQVAFPGGAIDPGETPVQAALREAHEEIALPLSAVHVIGTTDIFNSASGYSITPVLATVSPNLHLRANPAEVDEWFEVPLSFVLDPANHKENHIHWKGRDRSFIDMEWDGHRIWGVTGAILANLSKRLHWQAAAR